MRPTSADFEVILSLAIGKDLEEIGRMPAKSVARYRRFYNRCPFGPARSDLNAWLTAQHVWAGWNGKSKSMDESVLWFGKQRKKRPAKKKPPPGNIGRMMVEAAIAAGEKVTFYNADGTVKDGG